MNEKFYEALENCLQAIETGADIESVLERYPQMAEELRPILMVSFDARSLATTSVPEDAMRRGRARVLGHAARMRESTRSSRQSIFAFPRLATSLALALLFVLSGTGLVRASNGALPGDNLYPVKRTWEDMRLLLVFNPEGREELEDKFEQERLHEIDELFVEGRHETIEFSGLVTEQNGDQWLVAGITVQITPASKLPNEPVTFGASVKVEGHTNAQGFVEADEIEILEPGISLPPFEPPEIEDPEDAEQNENPIMENNDNGDQDEDEIETMLDDKQESKSTDDGNDGKEIDNSSDDGDNSSSNKGSDGGDNSNTDDHESDSDSGGGGDDGDSENNGD